MSLQTILILILTGIAAGILGGLVGVGGGLIIVPSLVYFFELFAKNCTRNIAWFIAAACRHFRGASIL